MINKTLDETVKETEISVRNCQDSVKTQGAPMYRKDNGVLYACGLKEELKACKGEVQCPYYHVDSCFHNGEKRKYFGIRGEVE